MVFANPPDPIVFTEQDLLNMQSVELVSTTAIFNFSTTYSQVLFSDARFQELLDAISYTELAEELYFNFDGYSLYQEVSWTRPSSFTDLARGIFTEIPYRGYVGWVCVYVDDTSYKCHSRFVTIEKFDL